MPSLGRMDARQAVENAKAPEPFDFPPSNLRLARRDLPVADRANARKSNTQGYQ